MLRSFDLVALVDRSVVGVAAILGVLRIASWWRRQPVVRLMLARPLWWLAARMLAVPDVDARYPDFRDRVLARWEALLLDDQSTPMGSPQPSGDDDQSSST